jgi:YaiO family outer membrane protein
VVPRIAVAAESPDRLSWWIGAAVTLGLFLAMLKVPDRWLPLRYYVWLLCSVQASAQLFFHFVPAAFPYDVVGYTETLFIAGLFIVGLVPLLYGLTYFSLDFDRKRKLFLTLLTMGHLGIFIPIQYLAHAWILHHGSLLLMPLLFWAFGLSLDVAIVIGIYSWAVSWNPLPYLRDTWGVPARRVTVHLSVAVLLLLLLLLLLPVTSVRAEEPSRRYTVDVGLSLGRYTENLGNSDAQFAALSLERPWLDRWRFDLGRAARFEDAGVGVGALYSRHLRRNTQVSGGFSSGTGDVIFPKWRVDLGLRQTGLFDNRMLFDLGYTHTQSKAENYSNALGGGVRWYTSSPWSFGLGGRVEWGQPGNTVSRSMNFGVDYGLYRKLYVGAGMEIGEVAYVLVAKDLAFVDFSIRSYRLGSTWYVRDDRGLTVELNYLDTEFYDQRSFTVRVFKEW